MIAGAAPRTPDLTCGLPADEGIHLSNDGVVELAWTSEDGSIYQLEQRSGDSEFERRYEGADLASVRTGLTAGDHVFRVRALDENQQPGPWAEIGIRVEYMDPARVRLLLVTGGIVVIATVIAILHGHLSHRREDIP